VEFNFARLVITLRLETDIDDPLALFGLRSLFAEAFRRVSGCQSMHGMDYPCPYCRNFSQSMSDDPVAVRRYQKPPLPFAFSLPLLTQLPNRGAIVEVGLTLVGSAVQHAAVYLDAFQLALSRFGPASRFAAMPLKAVSIDYYGARSLLWEKGEDVCADHLVLLSMEGLQQTCTLSPDAVTLHISTPLRLMKEGMPLRDLTFSPLVRHLFRRISALAYYYCDYEMDEDFRWLAERSTDIRCTMADFHWQDVRGSFSGTLGRGTFCGELSEYLPFLLLGQFVQCGKGAAYGFGNFRVEKTVDDLSTPNLWLNLQ
jgi:hypothetical protein